MSLAEKFVIKLRHREKQMTFGVWWASFESFVLIALKGEREHQDFWMKFVTSIASLTLEQC